MAPKRGRNPRQKVRMETRATPPTTRGPDVLGSVPGWGSGGLAAATPSGRAQQAFAGPRLGCRSWMGGGAACAVLLGQTARSPWERG